MLRATVERGLAMTEAERLQSTSPQKILEYLRGKPSNRKRRPFARAPDTLSGGATLPGSDAGVKSTT
jgi:hypothetical protein